MPRDRATSLPDEVHVAPTPDSNTEEADEAATLVSEIKKSIADLDAESLAVGTLSTLHSAVGRLAEIAEMRETKRRDTLRLQSKIEEWGASKAAKLKILVDPAPLGDILGSLKESAADIGQEEVEAILADCDAALAIEDRFREKKEAYQQAIKENNYELVSSLALAMKSLEGERDTAYAAIGEAISERTRTRVEGKADSDADAKSEETTKDDDPEAHRSEPERKTVSTEEPLVEDHQESTESTADSDRDTGDDSSDRLPVDETREVDEVPTDELADPNNLDEPSVQQTILDDREASVEQIEAKIATEIKRGRFGLAYHLALAEPEALPSPSVIEFVASNYVTDESAPVVSDLHRLVAELLNKTEEALNKKSVTVQRSYATLIASAALSPALVTPHGLVAQLLKSMEPRLDTLPSLRELVQSVSDASNKGAYLPIELIREDSLEEWKEKVEALQKEGRTWVEAERRSKIKYSRATKVWYRILDDWEDKRCSSIGRIFKLLEEPIDNINIAVVEKIAAYWRQHRDREIDRIDRSIRPPRSTNDITAGARLRLQEKISEAVSFSDRWCRLLEVRPTQEKSFHEEWKNKLYNTLQTYGEAALQEIAGLDTPVAYRAEKLVQRYIAMFEDDDLEPPTSHLRLQDLLNGDLFADPTVRFDDSAYPSETPLEIGCLLRLVGQNELDFPRAIIERAKYGDFGGVEMALDFVKRAGCLSEDTIDRIRFQVDSEREQVEKELEKRIRDTGDRLDAAYARGTLTKEEVDNLHLDIPSNDLSEINDFEPYFKKYERIGEEIEESRQKRRGEVTKRLALLKKKKKAKPENIDRIEKAIEANSYQVAEDYIERVEQGESLPEHELKSDRVFDYFFPQFVEEYTTFKRDAETPDTLEQIRIALENRQHIGPVDATRLSANSASDGANFIKTWSELRSGNTASSLFKALMRTLGFTDVEVSSERQTNTGGKEFFLRTKPIANRHITQLPDFGSRANGRYRLVSSSLEYSTVEAILQTAEQSNIPTIVLFWDILDIEERLELARNFGFGTYEPTLVLDEALIAFLATKSGERLSAFFDCASAFSFSQPFDPEAIEVPPEMFFGRENERRAILNTSGDMTHLVYGGRRLGKTALFRDIEREYNESPNELVLFLSLRGSEIGQNQPTDQLWRLFAKELVNHNIVDSRTLRPESVGLGVRKWLNENSSRRILFLVDEADDFLDAEQKSGYQVLERIKNLMEDTKRKFKVVFAGLHNVQRATRDPNNPFSHMMGRPVRIGPMLPDAEPALIESLIRAPLETLGYRFDSTDSVIRIAAETNYYPALAQLFCKDLLHNLRENDVVGPPYTIRREDIDRVFDSRETRDRIRDLFRWTIQLDPRYEFLTYLIARESFDNENVESNGVSIADIRTISLKDWHQGFDSDQSFWIFEILLEEMVGLGILREVADQKFSIRTRNLRMLLGNDDEIKRRYDDAKERDPLERPHPSEFRRTINGRPAPLTASQENKLLSSEPSVGLIFGTCLAGLYQVSQSLKQLCKSLNQNDHTGGPAIELHDASNATSLLSKLSQVSKRRRKGFYIVLVDSGAWDRDLIGKVLEFVSRHRARNRIIRPVFLGGPAEAWHWLKEPLPRSKGNAVLWDIWLGPCDKNFARTWLMKEESLAHNDLANRDRMLDLPWPVVVEAAAFKEPISESIEEATRVALADQDLVSDILRLPETESALRILSNMFPDEMTPDDLSELSEEREVSPEDAFRILDWASRLGIVHDREDYRLDSAYATGLKEIF
ncbi:MAG: hypothetical protein OXI58_12890 [Gemmatimonadota bacterium]|nr:hypothetical protein [Gemmatimonadota bacterium]